MLFLPIESGVNRTNGSSSMARLGAKTASYRPDRAELQSAALRPRALRACPRHRRRNAGSQRQHRSDIQLATVFDAIRAGHATPKIDVRGVVFREDKILLVQEKLDNYRWTLPGGWADIGESPSEATVREIYEESGYSRGRSSCWRSTTATSTIIRPFPFTPTKPSSAAN